VSYKNKKNKNIQKKETFKFLLYKQMGEKIVYKLPKLFLFIYEKSCQKSLY